jgi:hypothetical protein
MQSDEDNATADPEQIEILEGLIARMRASAIHTGIRDDELQDLDRVAAGELIEQLRRRLGELQD